MRCGLMRVTVYSLCPQLSPSFLCVSMWLLGVSAFLRSCIMCFQGQNTCLKGVLGSDAGQPIPSPSSSSSSQLIVTTETRDAIQTHAVAVHAKMLQQEKVANELSSGRHEAQKVFTIYLLPRDGQLEWCLGRVTWSPPSASSRTAPPPTRPPA